MRALKENDAGLLLTPCMDFGVQLFTFSEETHSFIPFFVKKQSP